MKSSDHLRILLGTYDGAAHLEAQLDSFLGQDYADWSLDIADDGSTDDTPGILAGFAAKAGGRVRLMEGPRQGAAANFLDLARQAVEDAPGAALAFADQDDVWLPHKTGRAMRWLAGQGAAEGAVLVYVCRTVLVGADLRRRGLSRQHPRGPSFGNALVQNILAGNTLVLSPAAARILAESVPAARQAGVRHHDWWVYQLLAGAGARIECDPEPGLLYRQHGGNHMGHHGPVQGRMRRMGIVMRRGYAGWIDQNLAGLEGCAELLTPEYRVHLAEFATARRRGGRALAEAMRRLAIHRQTPAGDRFLAMLAMGGRL